MSGADRDTTPSRPPSSFPSVQKEMFTMDKPSVVFLDLNGVVTFFFFLLDNPTPYHVTRVPGYEPNYETTMREL